MDKVIAAELQRGYLIMGRATAGIAAIQMWCQKFEMELPPLTRAAMDKGAVVFEVTSDLDSETSAEKRDAE